MKLIRLVRIFVLISLLGGSGLIYAQDQQNDAKPSQEEARPEATKPAHDEATAPRQDDAKPPKQDEVKPQRDESKPASQEEAKPSKQEEQAQRSDNQHGRIPEDKFRAHFGRQHTLVIHRPTVVNGQPRFQYSGYWFTIVDPWPVGWAYTDQCYIDYIDGEYFLFDLLHPGVRVAITVVM
ncbi:MAG: hypothetical protein WAK89_00565 [Candidatus Sulfotelmatobacter sp.]